MTSSFVCLTRSRAISVVLSVLSSCMAAKQTPASAPPALVGMPGAAADQAAQPRQIPPFDGVWKLNTEASVNPNGPAVPEHWPRDIGETSGYNFGWVGSLSTAERAWFDAMTTLFFTAPPIVGVSATATEFTLVLDPAARLGYMHKTDNKAQPLVTSAGPAEFKVRWDGNKIRRELEAKRALHIIEEYMLSSDDTQLIVMVKADSRVVSMKNGEIKRVYDRVGVP